MRLLYHRSDFLNHRVNSIPASLRTDRSSSGSIILALLSLSNDHISLVLIKTATSQGVHSISSGDLVKDRIPSKAPHSCDLVGNLSRR